MVRPRVERPNAHTFDRHDLSSRSETIRERSLRAYVVVVVVIVVRVVVVGGGDAGHAKMTTAAAARRKP